MFTLYMQSSQINRVMKLVKKTGDKVVLMDNESDAVMMLMDIDAYEKLLTVSQPVEVTPRIEHLTEEELMEKINKDVAVWRAYNDKERLETIDQVIDKNAVSEYVANKARSSDYVEKHEELARGAKPVENTTEESAKDIAEDEGEEKFYLEPVE